MKEILVVLRTGAAAQAFTGLRDRFRAVSSFPPRILVIAGADAVDFDRQLTGPQLAPDVECVVATSEDAAPASLNESEKLFVDAWKLRLAKGNQKRVGDGLAWDAPGFESPDKYH